MFFLPKKGGEINMHGVKHISCIPECGFMVQSHDEDEIVDMAKMHVETAHNQTIADGDIKSQIEEE